MWRAWALTTACASGTGRTPCPRPRRSTRRASPTTGGRRSPPTAGRCSRSTSQGPSAPGTRLGRALVQRIAGDVTGGFVTAGGVSPDGSRFAIARPDGVIEVRPTSGAGRPTLLRGHGAGVLGLAFSADGGHLASAGNDGSLRVWDLRSGSARVLRKRRELPLRRRPQRRRRSRGGHRRGGHRVRLRRGDRRPAGGVPRPRRGRGGGRPQPRRPQGRERGGRSVGAGLGRRDRRGDGPSGPRERGRDRRVRRRRHPGHLRRR